MQTVLGWDDDRSVPLLLLEDLSHTTWPPPWTPKRVETVQSTLADVASTVPPPWGMILRSVNEQTCPDGCVSGMIRSRS